MKLIKKISPVFLAAIFLFSSLGLTISSMVCLKSEKAKVAFTKIEDCCSINPETPCCEGEQELSSFENSTTMIEKDDCCEINNFILQLNDFQTSQKLNIDHPVVLQSIFYSAISYLTHAEDKSLLDFTETSPPFHGRILLNFISTLVI